MDLSGPHEEQQADSEAVPIRQFLLCNQGNKFGCCVWNFTGV